MSFGKMLQNTAAGVRASTIVNRPSWIILLHTTYLHNTPTQQPYISHATSLNSPPTKYAYTNCLYNTPTQHLYIDHQHNKPTQYSYTTRLQTLLHNTPTQQSYTDTVHLHNTTTQHPYVSHIRNTLT